MSAMDLRPRPFFSGPTDLFRVFDSFFEPESTISWGPAIDLSEDKTGIIISADLPGFEQSDVNVQIEHRTLTISGSRKIDRKGSQYIRAERFSGTFSRAFTLPASVDIEKVQAEMKNGVLTIKLPKREDAKPRSIQVKIEA